ncbi:hypothetical protein OIDMADRAFT_75771, partial [Oidiodendron maius Zn]
NHYQHEGGYYEGDEHALYHYEGGNDCYYEEAPSTFSQQKPQSQDYRSQGKHRDHHEEGEYVNDFTLRPDITGATDVGYSDDDAQYSSYNTNRMDNQVYRPSSSRNSCSDNRSLRASTPNDGMDYNTVLPAIQRPREPYHAWNSDAHIPLSKEEIEDIFLDLTAKFGFQRDGMRNMYDHFMTLLDSRASRMTPNQALLSLHSDYIGGDNANYRKWYFAAHLDLDDAVGFANIKLGKA